MSDETKRSDELNENELNEATGGLRVGGTNKSGGIKPGNVSPVTKPGSKSIRPGSTLDEASGFTPRADGPVKDPNIPDNTSRR